ncbi:MAG: NAD(+) diphosphatase [Erysipelotrichaceae bacterium]|nr:NAD(+) diphosphatase [Erysipelotrichaceae bacterium]
MIQDILPKIFNNQYIVKEAKDNDFIVQFENNAILLNTDNSFIKYSQIKDKELKLYYLFSIDNQNVFLTNSIKKSDFKKVEIRELRYFNNNWVSFVGITAYQINNWLIDNKYCGRCASLMNHSINERALICNNCNNIIYPKINPAVIVLIKDGNRAVLTKYKRGSGKYALVAGFCEIGETVEETVKREVLEEVGLKVKNIKYYKSQPWSFTDSLLLGFICDLDGDDTITVDEIELSEARWLYREEIPEFQNNTSLTQELISAFKNNKI